MWDKKHANHAENKSEQLMSWVVSNFLFIEKIKFYWILQRIKWAKNKLMSIK